MNDIAKHETLLEVSDLDISLHTRHGTFHVVNGISYRIHKGQAMGIVGESGSGKTIGAYALLGLLKHPAKINSGTVVLNGRNLLTLLPNEISAIRGREISMVFQNPVGSLDPVYTIGQQIIETIRIYDKSIKYQNAVDQARQALNAVGIQNAEVVLGLYPFELSGGMCQRVIIAISLLGAPKLLIADEPTTALDVTSQAQIVSIFKRLKNERRMSILFISHDFRIVADLCDMVSVMCEGFILEQGSLEDVLRHPVHPYTLALIESIPHLDAPKDKPLPQIGGRPTETIYTIIGCVFASRCSQTLPICTQQMPPSIMVDEEHSARCWRLHGYS